MKESWSNLAAACCAAMLCIFICGVAAAPQKISDGPPLHPQKSVWRDATPMSGSISRQGNKSPYTVKGRSYEVLDSSSHYRASGIASWYGTKFHGKHTANGEIYNLFGATAAHRSLPLPSYVRVTNLTNERSVLLRVNDRGPFRDDRIIDLSYGAALTLGFAEQGVAPVLVETVAQSDPTTDWMGASNRYRYLQLGAYLSLANAQLVSYEASRQPEWRFPVVISEAEVGGQQFHRVRVGPFADPISLERARDALIEAGFPSPQRLP